MYHLISNDCRSCLRSSKLSSILILTSSKSSKRCTLFLTINVTKTISLVLSLYPSKPCRMVIPCKVSRPHQRPNARNELSLATDWRTGQEITVNLSIRDEMTWVNLLVNGNLVVKYLRYSIFRFLFLWHWQHWFYTGLSWFGWLAWLAFDVGGGCPFHGQKICLFHFKEYKYPLYLTCIPPKKKDWKRITSPFFIFFKFEKAKAIWETKCMGDSFFYIPVQFFSCCKPIDDKPSNHL